MGTDTRALRVQDRGWSAHHAGVALVLAVLILALLGTSAAALLFVSGQQRRVAAARGAALRSRLAAESAVRAALAEWHSDRFRDLEPGTLRAIPGAGGALPGGVRYRATTERLAGPLYLVRGRGWLVAPASPATAAVGVLVRVLEPAEAWSEFPAGVTAAAGVRVGSGGVVDATGTLDPPPGWSGAVCPAEADRTMQRLFGAGARPGVLAPDSAAVLADDGAVIRGDPPVGIDAGAADAPGLGPLDWADLRALADRTVAGSVSPRPVHEDGRCALDAPGNWGSPLDPDGPCGDYFPLIYAEGTLELRAGAGQGVLVVDGDLLLGPDARFFGAVLIGGRLLAPDGGAIHGAARIGGPAGPSVVGDGAVVAYRACALWRAFARAPALNRPFRPPGRWWVPVF